MTIRKCRCLDAIWETITILNQLAISLGTWILNGLWLNQLGVDRSSNFLISKWKLLFYIQWKAEKCVVSFFPPMHSRRFVQLASPRKRIEVFPFMSLNLFLVIFSHFPSSSLKSLLWMSRVVMLPSVVDQKAWQRYLTDTRQKFWLPWWLRR